jgi:hypothetical protein
MLLSNVVRWSFSSAGETSAGTESARACVHAERRSSDTKVSLVSSPVDGHPGRRQHSPHKLTPTEEGQRLLALGDQDEPHFSCIALGFAGTSSVFGSEQTKKQETHMRSHLTLQSGRGFTNLLLVIILATVLTGNASAQSGPAGAQALAGTGFTYQGQLKNANGLVNGICDFQFSLWDANSAGAQVGATQTMAGVSVSGGLFTVQLNEAGQFGASAFNGQGRWVQVAVKCAGDPAPITLNPRQPLTPTPYALALPGLRTEQNSISPNIIGGVSGNAVASGVVGASLVGGGTSGFFQAITDDYGTVGGGRGNIAGNLTISTTDAVAATVGGGEDNTATGPYATIPGGQNNSAGAFSLAAGRRAKAVNTGSFVWADSTNADFTSTADNQFSIRAANGLFIANDAGGAKVVPVGTRYRDNAIVAWARVTAAGGLDTNFNVASVTRMSTGYYSFTLNSSLSSGFSLIPIVTPEIDAPGGIVPVGAANVRLVATDQVAAGNTFNVYIYNGNFALVDNDFQVLVTGR